MSELLCWNCGASLADIPRPISRHANCGKCFEVLHCCRMCKHYDPDRRPYCDHDRADPPVEKESANFCDFFKPVNRYEASRDQTTGHAKDELAALFGDEETEVVKPDDGVRNKLDDLFDD